MAAADESRDVIARLDAALTALETAVARVAGADKVRADLAETLAVMDDDRQRLASDLDAALSRAQTLAAANEAVAMRLERLGATLGASLDPEIGAVDGDAVP
jgi:hypothetical protein